MKTTTILCFSLYLCSSIIAQNDLAKIYDEQTIYIQGNKWVKNGQAHRAGYFPKDLKAEMTISPDATLEFKRFEKNRTASLILSGVSLAATLLAVPVSDNNRDLGTGLYTVGLAGIIATIPISIKTVKNLHKSVWLRNRAVLLKPY